MFCHIRREAKQAVAQDCGTHDVEGNEGGRMRNRRSRAALEINRPIVVVNGDHLPGAVPCSRIVDFVRPVNRVVLGREAVPWTIDRLMRSTSPTYTSPPNAFLSSWSSSSDSSQSRKYSHQADFSSRRCHSNICARSQHARCSSVHWASSSGSGASSRAVSAPTSCKPCAQFLARLARLGSSVVAGHDRSLLPVPCADLPANPAAAAPTCSRPGCSPRWS